ncbi:helix-turn-helix domain-containing protein [Leisingera sp. ANG-M7]|uniref:helix-turn-helix domain-containing protein n=1 Tax=Leisingera sp. ANG-M7 TaxID=1577902 RepID=UPI0009DD5E45|nr:helix-turn-helix domain-containing protein [Leisingera sp. ANG-M7]
MSRLEPLTVPAPRQFADSAALARFHDVEIILPQPDSPAAAQMICEVFRAANDLFPDSGYRTAVRNLASQMRSVPEGWKPQTVIFLGGISSRWPLNSGERASLQRICRQAQRCLFAGSAIFLLPETGLNTAVETAVHANFAAAAEEEQMICAPAGTLTTTSGRISTAVSSFAALRLLVAFLRADRGAFIADAVCDYLGLAFGPASEQSKVSLQLRQTAGGDALVVKILDLMQQNLEEPLLIRDIAQQAGVSPRKLERRFQQKAQTSPLTAYRKLRIEKARQLLLHTTLPLAEIVAATGFGSRSSLTEWFKREYKTSPQAFRKQYYADRHTAGSLA